MAFVRLAFFPGGTADQYAAISAAVSSVDPPGDRLVFAAGPVEGGWQVVQLWTSKVALDTFNREVFFPALATADKGGFTGQPIVIDFEPNEFVVREPPGSTAVTR